MSQLNKKILADYLDSLQKHGIPGCDCVVYHNHQPIFRHTAGFADCNKTKPLTEANTYWLYSASKLITCTAAMQLVEKGLISLDAPVSDYLCEYKNMKVRDGSDVKQAKNAMTVRHL